MSEEEKREYIEHEILDRLYCLEENDFDKSKVDDSYIKAVLNACKEAKNLIEKQQKEIVKIKKDYSDMLLQENVISKDKIKEKIKYIEDNYSEHSEVRIGKCIEFLDELLEE